MLVSILLAKVYKSSLAFRFGKMIPVEMRSVDDDGKLYMLLKQNDLMNDY